VNALARDTFPTLFDTFTPQNWCDYYLDAAGRCQVLARTAIREADFSEARRWTAQAMAMREKASEALRTPTF
jgi:hypothetical protein